MQLISNGLGSHRKIKQTMPRSSHLLQNIMKLIIQITGLVTDLCTKQKYFIHLSTIPNSNSGKKLFYSVSKLAALQFYSRHLDSQNIVIYKYSKKKKKGHTVRNHICWVYRFFLKVLGELDYYLLARSIVARVQKQRSKRQATITSPLTGYVQEKKKSVFGFASIYTFH